MRPPPGDSTLLDSRMPAVVGLHVVHAGRIAERLDLGRRVVQPERLERRRLDQQPAVCASNTW